MKKGFTLIELLSVIIILAIILVIVVPQILNVINSAKQSSFENQVSLFEKAASRYIEDRVINNEYIEEYITAEMLYDKKLLNNNSFIGVIKVERQDKNYKLTYLDVNDSYGEVVLIDPNKTVSNIIVEGNTVQENTTLGINLLDPNKLIKAATNATEIIDGVESYKYSAQTNRDIEPIFLSAGTYTLTSKAKRVFGTNGESQTQYWGFDLANRTMSYPTAIVKSTLVQNVNTKDWFTTVRTFTLSEDTWIDRIHEYSYSLTTAGYYYVDINSIGLYSGSYNLSTLPNYEKFTPDSPTPNYPSEIKNIENSKLIGYSKNLFNKNKVINGSYYSSTGTLVTSANSTRLDDFIKIKNNANYYWTPVNNNIIINTFDENYNHIERFLLYTTYSYKFNSNVKYIKISSYNKNYDFNDFMFFEDFQNFSNYIEYTGFEVELPILRGFENVKDTYSISDGLYTKKIDEKTFNGTETWSISGFASADYYVGYTSLTDVAFTYNDIEGFCTHGKVVPSTLISTIQSGFIHNSNSSHWLKFPRQIVSDTAFMAPYLLQQFNNDTPVIVNYEKRTVQQQSLTPKTIPNNLNYIYLDGEVKGNIIVEYN